MFGVSPFLGCVRLLFFPLSLPAGSPSLMPREEWTEVVRRRQRREQKYERMERDPASKPRKERRPEWQCAVCSSRNWMTRETCRDCEKKRTATDVVIEGMSPTFPPQPPPQKQRTPVQAAEGAFRAACEAGLPQSLLDELLSQVEAPKAERDAEKPIGTRLNSARARLQRATTRGAKAKAARRRPRRGSKKQ